ncbi:MAG: purine-nucleoside phosphorylase [Planctomycetota bacterium]
MSFSETPHELRVADAVDFLAPKLNPKWQELISGVSVTGVILGSGLGSLAEKIQPQLTIKYGDIPGFASSTASGHRGELIFGTLHGKPVIAMAGRLHRYEGWSNDQVSFPVSVMHALGARRLIASNAAGGLNPNLRVGDIIVLSDHVDWLHQRSASFSSSPKRTGFLRADRPIYRRELIDQALLAARNNSFRAFEGTYLATLGPTYETRAEYRMMRRLGADVVGMSTVPEVLTAASLEMDVLALSVVSNVASPDDAIIADHEEVLQAGDAAAGKLESIVRFVTG